MIQDAALTADLLVNGTALATILMAVVAMRRGASLAPAGRRLRALYLVLAILLALRAFYWMSRSGWLAIPVTMAACWLPLFALRLIEDLLRRHASAALKWLALGGAMLFSVAAIVTGAFIPKPLLTALALFQVIMLIGLVWFVARTRKAGLSPAETGLADTFALALLLAIPFALSDFRDILPGLPVRMGSIGVLIFAVATSRLLSGFGAPRLFLADVAAMFLCGLLVVGGEALLNLSLASGDLIRLFALTVAGVAAMLVFQRLREARAVARLRPSIIGAVARLPETSDIDALVGCHPVTASGRIVAGSGLALYDADAITALTGHRVITAETVLDPGPGSAASNLLSENEATHLVLLSRDPPQFLAVASGQIGRSGSIDVELDMLSRLAQGTRR
ncbi:hypothetical protein [Sphingosinicella sp. BN140058]|uniref:hypothetical protein n=1 Tax=Sphingosinicella sp. BN140058 TaxID=1892855 RepID=UPI0010129950|nr:hypothetical protein [Sphingosinicella sp. BN140058]QAY78366.1 hypothetical protein ETR14_18870 [Sphingosinicella sp. BN140058]